MSVRDTTGPPFSSLTARQLSLLRIIRNAGQVTRHDLKRRTGLSESQVSRITSQLIARGWIATDGRVDSAAGRPSDWLTIGTEGRYVIGLDIGGGVQRAVLINLRGDVLTTRYLPAPDTNDQQVAIDCWHTLITDVTAAAGQSLESVIGIGIGLRAIVDRVTGIVSGWPDAPTWSAAWPGFSVRDGLAAVFPRKLLIVDDTVRAIAVAEARYGHGQQESDFVFVFADSGIGAAIMIDGRPYIGANRLAGEIGHIALGLSDRQCGCGKTGCIETVASVSSLLTRAAAMWPSQPTTIAKLITASEQGDIDARTLLDEGGHALGRSMAILLDLLSPRLIIIGGVLAASTVYVDAARQAMFRYALPQGTQNVRLEISAPDEFAGAHGAATMAVDALFNPPGVDHGFRLRRPRQNARLRTRALT